MIQKNLKDCKRIKTIQNIPNCSRNSELLAAEEKKANGPLPPNPPVESKN